MDHDGAVAYRLIIPDTPVYFVKRENPSSVTNHKLEYSVFCICQRNACSVLYYGFTLGVECDSGKRNLTSRRIPDGTLSLHGSAKSRFDPHQKLDVGKRLYDIIVCSSREAHYLILLTGEGCKEEYRSIRLLSYLNRRHNSRLPRHAYIENHEINVFVRKLLRLGSILGLSDLIALTLEKKPQYISDLRLVICY